MSGELLSPFATVLLGIAAFLKIILHFPNPIKRELKQNEGKTAYQIEHEFERSLKKDGWNTIIIEHGIDLLYSICAVCSRHSQEIVEVVRATSKLRKGQRLQIRFCGACFTQRSAHQ